MLPRTGFSQSATQHTFCRPLREIRDESVTHLALKLLE